MCLTVVLNTCAAPRAQVRAAVLYFVLNDLGTVDPMYQFSLDAYAELFAVSLKWVPAWEYHPVSNNITLFHAHTVSTALPHHAWRANMQQGWMRRTRACMWCKC